MSAENKPPREGHECDGCGHMRLFFGRDEQGRLRCFDCVT